MKDRLGLFDCKISIEGARAFAFVSYPVTLTDTSQLLQDRQPSEQVVSQHSALAPPAIWKANLAACECSEPPHGSARGLCKDPFAFFSWTGSISLKEPSECPSAQAVSQIPSLGSVVGLLHLGG